MTDGRLIRVLTVCGTVEAAAWGLAWFFDWALAWLVVAIGVSTVIAGVIFEAQRRRQRER